MLLSNKKNQHFWWKVRAIKILKVLKGRCETLGMNEAGGTHAPVTLVIIHLCRLCTGTYIITGMGVIKYHVFCSNRIKKISRRHIPYIRVS